MTLLHLLYDYPITTIIFVVLVGNLMVDLVKAVRR